MLILVRRVEQSIEIGDDIWVKVLGVERGRVKLGIYAPQDVSVKRGEIEGEYVRRATSRD